MLWSYNRYNSYIAILSSSCSGRQHYIITSEDEGSKTLVHLSNRTYKPITQYGIYIPFILYQLGNRTIKTINPIKQFNLYAQDVLIYYFRVCEQEDLLEVDINICRSSKFFLYNFFFSQIRLHVEDSASSLYKRSERKGHYTMVAHNKFIRRSVNYFS